MKNLLCLLSAWLCLISQAHAEWSNFVWAKSMIPGLQSNNGAIILPVMLDGTICHMQLDTGLDRSVLYRNTLPDVYAHKVAGMTLVIKEFSYNSQPRENAEFALIYDRHDVAPENPSLVDQDIVVAGSMGNDRFLGGSLSLDLRNSRFEYTPGSFSTETRSQVEHIFDIELLHTDNGMIPLLTLRHKNRDQKFLLDTGSAPAGLIIYREADWSEFVESDIQHAEEFDSVRWNKSIHGYNGLIKKTIFLGTWHIPKDTTATYVQIPGEEAANGNPIVGIVGLAMFENKIVTIDYISKKLYIQSTK